MLHIRAQTFTEWDAVMTRDEASSDLRRWSWIAYGVERAFRYMERISPASRFSHPLHTDLYMRLVRVNTLPVIVASYNHSGLRWSIAARDIPRRWFLRKTLDEDSFTHDLLKSGKECKQLGKQEGDTWFENEDAGRYEVREQCIRSHGSDALVLLYLEPKMMESRI